MNDDCIFVRGLSISERVRRGAELLDLHFGSRSAWARQIDPTVFDISNFQHCALGQVFGTYAHGREKLGLTEETAPEYGFISGTMRHMNVGRENQELDAAWLELLADVPAEPVRLEIKREDVKLLAKRFRQIDNPEHSLLATEIEIGGVVFSLR